MLTFHVNMSSCVCGPAEQLAGGSLLRSLSSCDSDAKKGEHIALRSCLTAGATASGEEGTPGG